VIRDSACAIKPSKLKRKCTSLPNLLLAFRMSRPKFFWVLVCRCSGMVNEVLLYLFECIQQKNGKSCFVSVGSGKEGK
jgi:uncharacterized protein (DUF4213/DUF364 family)